MLDVNFLDCVDADMATVHFYPNGTCDEFNMILYDSGGARRITPGHRHRVAPGDHVTNEERMKRLPNGIADGPAPRPPPQKNMARSLGGRGFTLMEVMIAMAIFFVAIFAILELVATNLRNARLLEEPRVDCGLVMADLYQTNKLDVGNEDIDDFEKLYPGYRCQQNIDPPDDWGLPATNGLRHVEYILRHPDGTVETNLSGFMWKPDSKPVPHGP